MSELHSFAGKDIMRFGCRKLTLYKISLEIGFDFLFVKMIKYLVVTGHGATLSVLRASRVNSSKAFKADETQLHTLEFSLLSKPAGRGGGGQYIKLLRILGKKFRCER